MKCSGKAGYFLNLKKEYGERAEALLKKLQEGKTVQGAFITDFIKIDYVNITKILLYMITKNKIKTSFDGLYVDKEYESFLTFLDEEKSIILPNKITSEEKDYTNELYLIGGEKENFGNIVREKMQNNIIHGSNDIKTENMETIQMEKGIHNVDQCELCSPYSVETNNNYEKIIIHKLELLNINDIMKYDGSIENVDKIIYYLNPCSVLSAYFLDIKKNEKVLDMCASPGGKSLVIASKLFGYDISPLNRIKNIESINDTHIEISCSLNLLNYYKCNRNGFLVINEYNKSRYDRLKQVLHKHLPKDLINSSNLHITNYNGLNLNSFMRFPKFHKILLDVPCSTDEHLINKGTCDLNKWTINVIKNNTYVQCELLMNSFQLLHTNGIIIYSTCALSYHENDEVIEKLLKKFKKQVKIIDFVEVEYQQRYEQAFMLVKQKQIGICPPAAMGAVNGMNSKKFDAVLVNSVDDGLNEVSSNRDEKKENDNKHEDYKRINQTIVSIKEGAANNCNSIYNNEFKEFKGKTNFLRFFEKTKYGYISLPDKSPFGVLYICKIQKILKNCN
ncbi:tRNA m5C-methyltransferase [Plasmodium brasilianum]|uniref:NOL1/NOP2/Sun domain family member 4 n=2 Tax=Plasmodium (Plasmodium) TaxID=418103 RepID=A0A1A8VXD1_PLAMA|nr:tRNA m5C-methyltransferase, putative [Plasmodium malariae]KAI4838235.1 tRNA m5C-methyltransferase [Plasmodium brasilianum]SBS85237.1 conserved Plasmodium protein, unknown function [Plasmodium malariae]SCN12632.1 tRNA m5C-methyltransferase, putative [Plasmodium malariae]